MRLPVMEGVIERRILVNYLVDPDCAQRILPQPFRPQLIRGFAIAGICLIRLGQLRPKGWPARAGLWSENAAHRIAVQWDQNGSRQRGVYIPRRDSNSRLNVAFGGRLFPGVHQHASFESHEDDGSYSVEVCSDDGRMKVLVAGQPATGISSKSVFSSLTEAAEFFDGGSLGYSATNRAGVYDGLQLVTLDQQIATLHVSRLASSFFDDATIFPLGSVEYDSAFLMRDIRHEGHHRERLVSEPVACGWPN